MVVAAVCCGLVAPQLSGGPPPVLPSGAVSELTANLERSRKHRQHIWRDTPPVNDDGTVNGYIEISRGDRAKWEFDMAANARAIDRVIPEQVGGYPVNYGFVPQTVSYDGDPFDVLVLGPPIAGGSLVRGTIVALMLMEDTGELDSKVVLAPAAAHARGAHALDASAQRTLADYFSGYKRDDPRARTSVPGWGSAADGLAYVQMTHAFFRQCGGRRSDCTVRAAAEP